MSDSTELRRIVGAMTERPWKHGSWQYETAPTFHYTEIRPANDGDVSITVDGPVPSNALDGVKNVIGGCGCCGSPFGRHEDGQAIATLANHAEAFVRLVEAAEAVMSAKNTDEDWAARNALIRALAAVHAVRGEP